MSVIPCNPQLFSWSTPPMDQQQSTSNYLNDYGPLLSVSEAQHILGLGRNSIYALLHNGQLRSIRVGKLYKIPRDALEIFLNSY